VQCVRLSVKDYKKIISDVRKRQKTFKRVGDEWFEVPDDFDQIEQDINKVFEEIDESFDQVEQSIDKVFRDIEKKFDI
jgi:DNA-binding ferritin-like protein